ncbi:MAG TPA: GNAT family N-acetyltransferase [Actinopolymorphaceae bacterium]
MMDDEHVVIRPYERRDRDQVLALAVRLTEGVAPWRDPDAVAQAVRGWVATYDDDIGRDDAAVYVAEAADRIVGFVGVSQRRHFTGERDGYIGELVVASDMERRGIGRRLVRTAEGWARGRGLSRIALDTGAANLTARRFYAALGYQEEDVRLSKAV